MCVSRGLFFDKHLKHIKLNEEFVPFTKMNLSYLTKVSLSKVSACTNAPTFQEVYDNEFMKAVYQSAVVSYEDLIRGKVNYDGAVRIVYHNRDSYKRVTKLLGLMDDFKVCAKFGTRWILFDFFLEWGSTSGVPGNRNVSPQGPDGLSGADGQLEGLRPELELTPSSISRRVDLIVLRGNYQNF